MDRRQKPRQSPADKEADFLPGSPPPQPSFDPLQQRSLDIELAGKLPAVFLSSPVRQPLVYRKRIRKMDLSLKSGDLAAVYADFPTAKNPDEKETRLLGYGLVNRKAEITVRMLSFGDDVPTQGFWDRTLKQAVSLRRDMLKLDQVCNSYRVVHAESDGLSGLMVDRFANVLSAEVFSLAMFERSKAILEQLMPLCDAEHFVIRAAPNVLAHEGFHREPIRSPDLPRHVVVQEYGTRFKISLDDGGHKTGFFCDQRDNRFKLASFCENKSVLDLCCYTGGFAVQAKKLGKARDVTGVDLDEVPLQTAKENANLNQCQIRFVHADIFPFMRDMIRNDRKFDVVVLDPPKLIRSRDEMEEGKKAHFDMNRLAIRLVNPGGLLLTCTCAGLLSNVEFQNLVLGAARSARYAGDGPEILQSALTSERELKILLRTGAASDHPIAGNCLETEYLHAIWLQIN